MAMETMQTILVPLDGSELAERALGPALQLAHARHASILLLQVVPQHAREPIEDQTADLAAAEAYLSRVANRLRQQHATVVVEACAGPTVDRIVDEARLWHNGLIVMSTHGRGGLDRLLHGSVADAVIHRARVPVLLIPARCGEHPLLLGDTILVPVDGSAFAENALAVGAELARELCMPLTILHALWWAPAPVEGLAPPPGALEEMAAAMRQYLDGLVRQVRRAGIEARGEVAIGRPASTIRRYADERRAAAIVMATHGRSPLGRFTMGSIANEVLTQLAHPLMLVRPEVPVRAGLDERATATQGGR
jgi:nucleotide-binding universal stress UspA family protein